VLISLCCVSLTSQLQPVSFQQQNKLKIYNSYHKDITESRILKNGHDTTSLERLTASPYISDIYGNCAVSQLVEYSRGGNLHDVIKRARMGDAEFGNLSPLTKLKIAYQLLAAVADMHSFESDGVPSLAHNDICCHQFILVDGVFKLNDFHLSVFIEKGKDSHRSCTTDPFYHHSVSNLRKCL
jgi:serine/threonine protein kinase